jgi:hypothetical protein
MYRIAFISCVLLLAGFQAQAQGVESATVDEEGTVQDISDLDLSMYEYPDEGQPEFGPTDTETFLESTTPQRDAIFGDVVPRKYFQWKRDLYTNHDLKLGFFYQSLYMSASETLPNSTNDNSWGQWWGLDLKWTPLNKGEDREGSLVLVAAEREAVGNYAVPAPWGANDLGSLYAVNFEWTQWDFAVEELYWEQWLGKKRFMFRVGNTAAGTMINPFRFKDARTSFTSTPFAFHESIPAPAQGAGLAAKWWPKEDSEFYISAVLNDANGNPSRGDFLGLDWGTFSKGEYFYAVEFGNIWRKGDGEFNRLFLTAFYVDENSFNEPPFPNEAGGGFKLMGSLQQGNWVEFASYTYNTAEGGALATFGKHTVTAGVVRLDPFGVKGEFGTGLIWFKPLPDLIPDVKLRNQTGFEAYWKILLTPNLWITPGFQFLWNPALNPTVDRVFIPHLKFRLAY